MSFLTPALLAGLLAIAVPVIVHLVQRERGRVVAFPSLMFLRKVPNQSVRRRAIRHWPLLALRVAAIALIVLAFARPFLTTGGAPAAATRGEREIVLLVDRSASMGYANHWARAQEAVRGVIRGLAAGDRATVVFFAGDVEIAARSDAGRAALKSAIDRAAPGPGATRYAPALRAATGLLASSPLSRREIVLVSDFQKSGWDPAQDVRLPPGIVLTTRSVAEPAASNVALVGLTFDQQPEAKGVKVTATARVANYATQAVADRDIALSVDDQQVDVRRVSIGASTSATVAFTPFTVGGQQARVTARLAADALPADDVFHAVVTANGRVPVLIIESPNPSPNASLYLSRALDVAAPPGFDTRVTAADRVTPAQISPAAVVVLNDTRPPSGAAGRALADAVSAGAGLLVSLGERSTWTAGDPDLLPGRLGPPVDRSSAGGGTLGSLDFSHPVLEIFASPRSGDLTSARVFRFRSLTAPQQVVARFDDGSVALAARRVGRGSVLAWTSTFDGDWNDFPLKPVFVPFVLQAMHHLGGLVEPRTWYTVGDAYDPAEAAPSRSRRAAVTSPVTAVSPSGHVVEAAPGAGPATVPLTETGFYEIRPHGEGDARAIAVNGTAAESDLAPMDPTELAAAVTASRARSQADDPGQLSPEQPERRQSLWWYLLVSGLLILVIEAMVAGRLPQRV